jgi:hypothetical protein
MSMGDPQLTNAFQWLSAENPTDDLNSLKKKYHFIADASGLNPNSYVQNAAMFRLKKQVNPLYLADATLAEVASKTSPELPIEPKLSVYEWWAVLNSNPALVTFYWQRLRLNPGPVAQLFRRNDAFKQAVNNLAANLPFVNATLQHFGAAPLTADTDITAPAETAKDALRNLYILNASSDETGAAFAYMMDDSKVSTEVLLGALDIMKAKAETLKIPAKTLYTYFLGNTKVLYKDINEPRLRAWV